MQICAMKLDLNLILKKDVHILNTGIPVLALFGITIFEALVFEPSALFQVCVLCSSLRTLNQKIESLLYILHWLQMCLLLDTLQKNQEKSCIKVPYACHSEYLFCLAFACVFTATKFD